MGDEVKAADKVEEKVVEAKPAAAVTVEKTVVEAKDGKPAAKVEASKKEVDVEDPSSDIEADDKGFISLPKKSFLKRIANKTARELRALFGTSDVDKILEQKKEYETLKAEKVDRDKKADEERRAKLAEEDRLKEDAKKEKDRADRAEALIVEKDEQQLIEKTERGVAKVAAGSIDEEFVDYALSKYRKHIKGLSNRAVEKLGEDDVAEWFQEFAEKHPKMAKASTDAKDDKGKETKQKVGATTAPKAKVVVKQLESGRFAGKTPRPGQPNSMTPAELRDYKASKGLSW